jgi:hypothetical protein
LPIIGRSLRGKLRKLRGFRELRELKESLSIICCEHLKGWTLADSETAERVSSLCGQSDGWQRRSARGISAGKAKKAQRTQRAQRAYIKLKALPAASISRVGPSPIRRLQRGFPHCVDRATSGSGDRPEGSLRGKLRKLREFRGLRELTESLSINYLLRSFQGLDPRRFGDCKWQRRSARGISAGKAQRIQRAQRAQRV